MYCNSRYCILLCSGKNTDSRVNYQSIQPGVVSSYIQYLLSACKQLEVAAVLEKDRKADWSVSFLELCRLGSRSRVCNVSFALF